MMRGRQSDVAQIKRLVVKHARDAFVSDQFIERNWRTLDYRGRPELAPAVAEYDRFIESLRCFDIDLEFLPSDTRVGLDSIYVRDASIACSEGMILCNMGKTARRNEPTAQEAVFRALKIPIRGAITGSGCVEGGDTVWIDERTLAVGRGYRTNDEGIRQLNALLGDCVDELLVVPLPHWRGPQDVFHLMSIVSPIDQDLALVFSPLIPVPFREALLSRGIDLVEVAEDEFESMGCNVLAVAPRRCVMLAGNAQTRARLERCGVEVHEYDGVEISAKGAGGPTCLTRPIVRS